MEYKELYALSCNFNETLKYYVIKQDQVNDIYYRAKVFLSDFTNMSYTNKKILDEFGCWLKCGGTIKLKNVLCHVKYDDSNLVHFNAMCLIDTVRTCL